MANPSLPFTGLPRPTPGPRFGTHLGIACLAAFAWLAGPAGAQSSSAEANNPFNEFMSPGGGVNLFSGDVAFSHALYSARGINGLNVPVALDYSGNVHLNVRARNDKAPTEWVGIGWRLAYGNIRCDHKETGIVADDRCFYTAPNGVAQEILKQGTAFILEKDPFWKVEAVPSADGSRYLGWTLTDVAGKRYRFGDFAEVPSQQPNATRYVFGWKQTTPRVVNYVGTGLSGAPTRYPFQWDLAEEIDVDGNTVRYAYDQIRKTVRSLSWTSPVEYTQAAYLKSIEIPGGGWIHFETKSKSADEVVDPDALLPEPDAFMEFFEDKYLDAIRVENVAHATIRTYRLGYAVENFQKDKAAGFSKRFLTSIEEKDADGDKVGTHRFEYAKDAPEDPSRPLGVLSALTTPLCGRVEYTLQKKTIEGTKKIFPWDKLGRFEKTARVVGGSLESGEEYIVIINGKNGEDKSNDLYIYNNEDGVWTEHLVEGLGNDPLPHRLGLANGKSVRVEAGEGFFAVIKDHGDQNHTVSIFHWNRSAWVKTNVNGHIVHITDLLSPSILTGNDMLVIGSHQPSSDVMEILSFFRRGDAWIAKAVEGLRGNGSLQLRGNHLMYFVPGGIVAIATWDGNDWPTTFRQDSKNGHNSFVLGKDFIFGVAESPMGVVAGVEVLPEYMVRGVNWQGFTWDWNLARTLDMEGVSWTNDDVPNIEAVGKDFALIRSDDKDHLHLYQSMGNKWRIALNRNMVNSDWDWIEARWGGEANDDLVLVRYPRIKWHWKWYYVVPYKELDSDAKIMAFNRLGSQWKPTDFGSLDYPNTSKNPVLGQDMFVHNTNPGNAQVWDGSSWIRTDWMRPFKTGAMSSISGSLMAENAGGEINLFRKFQNSLVNPVYAYVVAKKTVIDPIRGQKSEYAYEYADEGARYDIRAASAKFPKVTIYLPDHGSRAYWFHNGYTGPSASSNAGASESRDKRDLAGLVYREEDFTAAKKQVAQRDFTFEVYRNPGTWPNGARQIRLRAADSENKGVLKGTRYEYSNANGLVRKTTEAGSGGRDRITLVRFAHEFPLSYGQMGAVAKHMLAQVAESAIYETTTNDADPKSNTVTTWSVDSKGAWHPADTWIWNGGAPGSPSFVAFKHPGSGTNAKPWRFVGSVTGRDTRGRITQGTTSGGVSNCTNYGRDGAYVVSETVRAGCAEAALLTGDYDDPGAEYLDAESKWKQNDARLDAAQARYGAASIRVPAGRIGPAKTVGPVAPGRGYMFSAWVYPISVSPSSPVALIVKRSNGAEIKPDDGRFGSLHPGSSHGWQRITRTLSAEDLAGSSVDISAAAIGAAEFDIQDIRFLPTDALGTTRYFDGRFFLTGAKVSSDGAAEHFEYDAAMRIAKSYSEDDQGRKVLRSQSEYHLDACATLQGASGNLARLKVSAGTLAFDKTVRDYGEVWVDPLLDRVIVDFRPENPHEEVKIRIAGGQWVDPCCRGTGSQELTFMGPSVEFAIKVGNGAPYVMTFKRPATCWTPMGGQLSGGWASLPSAAAEPADRWVAYRADQDEGRLHVKRWNSASGGWSDVGGPISVGEAADITLKTVSGVPHVAYLEHVPHPQPDGSTLEVVQAVVKRWNGSAWAPLQGDGTVSRGPARDLAFDTRGDALWVAYVGWKRLEEASQDTAIQVYARKWDGTAWAKVGDRDGNGVADGVVSDSIARNVTLAIHPDGTPHIGYLGRARFLNGDNGQPAGAYTSPFPIVKKLILSGNRYIWGDLVSGNGGPTQQGEVLGVPGADKFQIAFVGSDLFLAAAYQYLVPVAGEADTYEKSGKRVLDVRKLQPGSVYTDKSHWFPIGTGTIPEDYAAAQLDATGDFHFAASAGAPALGFTTSHNQQKMTVIRFADGKWAAVGNPAFLPSDASAGSGRISIAQAGSGQPFAALRQDDPAQEASQYAIRAVEYSGTCPDLTMAQFLVFEGGQPVPLDWKFRPYILYHEGKVRSEAGTVGLAVVPASLPALSRIWVTAQDGSTQAWTSGTPLPDRFPVTLQPGSNLIQVELVSADSKQRLHYQVRLDRRAPLSVSGTIRFEDFVANPAFDFSKPGVYRVVVPAGKSTLGISVDLLTGQTVFVNGVPVGTHEKILVDLADGTTVIKIVLVDREGARREYDIQVIRGGEALPIEPRLEEVLGNPDGTFTARFGYENPNPQAREIQAGGLNGVEYHGQSGQDMGQPDRFEPGTVQAAFSVRFDGTPLTWTVEGKSVSASADMAEPAIRIEMRETAGSEPNISKPRLKVSNLSGQPLQGFKLSLWLTRTEVYYQEIVADKYYFDPSGIQMAVSSHPDNANLVRVDLAFPAAYALAAGASTGPDDIQLGVHFRNYYPGLWNRANDWSWQGIGPDFLRTPFVTVYDSQGRLISGREPDPAAVPQPPALTQNTVFSMDVAWPWQATVGGLSNNTTRKTEGLASLQAHGIGYVELSHLPMKTADISGEANRLLVDFYLPNGQSNPWWKGQVQLFIDCPSANWYNTNIGSKELTPLPAGSFSTLEFALSDAVLNILRGNYNDFRFKFVLSVNQAAELPALDNVRFGGVPIPPVTPPGDPPVPPGSGGAAFFSMDNVALWQAGVGGLTQTTTRRTEGTGAVQVEGTGYIEVTHAAARTQDITGETSKLRVDFYLPAGQSNPWWKGQVQLFIDCPSANWYNTNIGSKELTPLTDGAFSALEFTLSEAVLNVLRGNYNDFRFKWVLSINQATQKAVLDNMRFVP